MKKLLFLILILPFYVFAVANSSILAADTAYNTGNLSKLSQIYSYNHNSRIIAYIYAKGVLTKNIAAPAETFIAEKNDDYMRIDLIHQLLIYYYKNDDYTKYTHAFNLLPFTRTNTNERCGYDLSNANLGKSLKPTIDKTYLIANGIPPWCAKLIVNAYQVNKISANERDLMLINLILNKHTDTFNSIASSFNITPINFYNYNNNRIPHSDNRYKFVIAYKVSNVAKKFPDSAEQILDDSNLDSAIKTSIYGYIGINYALNQNFKAAIRMYQKSDSQYLSNDELEWQTRSYLALHQWSNAIASINNMPNEISSKNIWLYWMGKSLSKLGKDEEAITFYQKIPNDYTYYSMLALGELQKSVPFTEPTLKPKTTHDSSNLYLNNALTAFNLYVLGQANHRKSLCSMATTEWIYAAKLAPEAELIKMSNLARSYQFYDLSIAAADQMDIRDKTLSYPTPFLNSYIKYSLLHRIDPTYALAITRQESRFNYKVIAFDGGVGLMQIMPGTAAYIAQKTGYNHCYRQGYDCNIKFGTWYLGSLLHKFNDNNLYATAAYNGGPNRARKWQDNLDNLDVLLQLELIPINITRGYVQKVLSNKAVYDSELKKTHHVNFLEYIQSMSLHHYLSTPDDDKTDAGKL